MNPFCVTSCRSSGGGYVLGGLTFKYEQLSWGHKGDSFICKGNGIIDEFYSMILAMVLAANLPCFLLILFTCLFRLPNDFVSYLKTFQ